MKLLGIKIDAISKEDAIAALSKKQIIFTPNPEILLEARKNKHLRRALRKSTLNIPDGHGLQFVSTLLRLKKKWRRFALYLPALLVFLFWKKPFKREIPEVIHGSDFMNEVVKFAAKEGKKVFFLGAVDSVARKTAAAFKQKYPTLLIAGYSSKDPSFETVEMVMASGAEVLFVAYGAPKQEIWIAKYLSRLSKLHTIMAVGGSFDFWSGSVQRAPKWMRKTGLEWLWRLCLQPKTRGKRIWRALISFPMISFFASE